MISMRLDLTSLREAYKQGRSPVAIVEEVYSQIQTTGLGPVWISVIPREQALARARCLAEMAGTRPPLYGVPFAVKDNIDVAGMPTTAACPAFAYTPSESATVVTKLEEAGAILIGKTNMDQFATGLVGTRSPYGACSSVFSRWHISGGSSSGSAVAVAQGQVSFSLGTDTAGSGRIPAAFNNLIGLKPTRGSISTSGVVPACRSLDCVSIFALTSGDALEVFEQARGLDRKDPYSRMTKEAGVPWASGAFRFGVPHRNQLGFFGDPEPPHLYDHAIQTLQGLGGERVEFDFAPFQAAAELLYSGPWVAERRAAVKAFFGAHPDQVHPVVREIITGSQRYSAVDAFEAQYRLEELRSATAQTWDQVDFLLLPTAGTIYTIEEVQRDPIALNTNLGRYTNFVNLLDLAAVAVPAGFRADGIPFGVSLIAPAFTDAALLYLADRLHRKLNVQAGVTEIRLDEATPLTAPAVPLGCCLVAVVGAHLSGQPLNYQLTSAGARLIQSTRTAACYRLYALRDTVPAKPGLMREPGFNGHGIDVEVWAMPTAHFGNFVAAIPPPLGIGSIELSDGSLVKGFLCEPFAIANAKEITSLGGWRAYLRSLQ